MYSDPGYDSNRSIATRFGDLLNLVDQDYQVSRGQANTIVVWTDPTIQLVPSADEGRNSLVDLQLIEWAFTEQAVLLEPNDAVDLEHRLDILAKHQYLQKQSRGLYSIEDKLISLLIERTSTDN